MAEFIQPEYPIPFGIPGNGHMAYGPSVGHCKSCLTANRCGSTWETANTASNPGTCSTDGDCTGGDTCFKPGTTSWTNCAVRNPKNNAYTQLLGYCPYADKEYFSAMGQAVYWAACAGKNRNNDTLPGTGNCPQPHEFCTSNSISSCADLISATNTIQLAAALP